MESWLVDVKRVKIPRPKFGSSSRSYPTEPPKDYLYDDGSDNMKLRPNMSSSMNISKATEELRRAFQEKL